VTNQPRIDQAGASKGLPASRISRRAFLQAAGAGSGIAAGAVQVAHADAVAWREETDVAVVGSGAAALSAAASALMSGARVTVLEKAPITGGTTAKSGGVFWIPNNSHMRAMGLTDDPEALLHYMARVAFPALYRAEHPSLGAPADDYELMRVYIDDAPRVLDRLEAAGAVKAEFWTEADGQPHVDYFADLPEARTVRGHSLSPKNPDGGRGRGVHLITRLQGFIEARGAVVRVNQAVQDLVVDQERRIVGVRVRAPSGDQHMVRARRGVVFGSGGFANNAEMRTDFLRVPIFGACAVPTNEGDFVSIGQRIGAAFGTMNEAWLQQEILEQVLEFFSAPSGVFIVMGDSSLIVNRTGSRVVNEALPYNERTRAHLTWDPRLCEYPNRLLFFICDERTAERGQPPMPPRGTEARYVIKAQDLDSLADGLRRRLSELEPRIGRVELEADFKDQLRQTVEAFNRAAVAGADPAFHRGETQIEKAYHPRAEGNPFPNAAMHPISVSGPYSCVILVAGALDTKGGPRTDRFGRVLDTFGRPFERLYAAGNCAAACSGQGYWGGGGTIGPAMTFGFLAGEHAARLGAHLSTD
jgi:3-oxosteroid 1-dehydrogenase